MAEYIDREAFLKDIEERYCLPCKEAGKDYNGCRCRACWVDDMCGDVIDAPAADVAPVVRCKDCKYWQDNNDGYPHEECRWGHGETPYANDFCSYGERKEGGDGAKAD